MQENYGSRIDIAEYLLRYKEELPQWLREYSQGRKLSFSNILSGRVGYYPGSGFDGTLVKVGNISPFHKGRKGVIQSFYITLLLDNRGL